MPTIKLTPRQVEILQLSAEGIAPKVIAQKLYVSKRTVDFHRAEIYARLSTVEYGPVTSIQRAVFVAGKLGVL